jgi:hypothetical protein
MAVNNDKPQIWKEDISKSVDFYNDWFMEFAPKAFRETRVGTTKDVKVALELTENLTDVSSDVLQEHPYILPMLRMTTCPPIARDRLIGLAGASPNLVKTMEIDKKLPVRMGSDELLDNLRKIGGILEKMADPDIFIWKERGDKGKEDEVHRAATIVADRLCGTVSDPIIRNAQERRQLAVMQGWLEKRGYRILGSGEAEDFLSMPPGTFSFRFNVPVNLESGKKVNIPVDAVIMRLDGKQGDFPLLFEAKSAGDFTNVNKRRKEEAQKISQLRNSYGDKITFDLFLCGYFDSGYLGYEAAEGIDWVWEHRIEDLKLFGL